jgi:hypothetical protein
MAAMVSPSLGGLRVLALGALKLLLNLTNPFYIPGLDNVRHYYL